MTEMSSRANELNEGASAEADRAVVNGAASASAVPASIPDAVRFYVDCEFDGHNGDLISIAMVREDGVGLHVIAEDARITDPWVDENVIPILLSHHAAWTEIVTGNKVGTILRTFLGGEQNPVIVADSPVDIGRFCRAISTGEDGGWQSVHLPRMTFEVHNVDCYPTRLEGAVQHNAWWDAMALRDKLAQAIEAGAAKTEGLGPKDESAVPNGDAS